MKTNHIKTMAHVVGLTMALALFGLSPIALKAGEIPTGKGGASKLLELGGRSVAPKSEASYVNPMSCAKCKNEAVRRVDWSARGANKPTITVVRHLCDGCSNEWVVSGHGKAKATTAVHVCTGCGAEGSACCSNSKPGVAATKGTEKKFEVAPVK